MNNRLAIALLFISSLFSISGHTATYSFGSAAVLEVELPPNDPQVFYNFLLWKVRGTCEVISDAPQNPLSFKMLNNKGTLDGVEFAEGSSLSLVASAGQKFQLVAEPRAKVEITNHGDVTVKIHCASN